MTRRLPITAAQRKQIQRRAVFNEQQRCIRIVRRIGKATNAGTNSIDAIVNWIVSGKDPSDGE